MNMMNTMRRGLATTAMSLVCLMAGTMNTLAATDAGTELVSQIDAAAGEEKQTALPPKQPRHHLVRLPIRS